nr:tail fiber domain-containing protein [uncultured Draconibacterium sp.]
MVYSQEEEPDLSKFNPTVAWRTKVRNVTMQAENTFVVEVKPLDWNEPGAATMTIGNYLIDYGGFVFNIIDSTETTITVVNLYKNGIGPQIGRTGIVYKSVGKGESIALAPVYYSYLSPYARENMRRYELEVLWDAITDTIKADEVFIDDFGEYFDSLTVEGALQEGAQALIDTALKIREDMIDPTLIQFLDERETIITDSDNKYPTSGAVVDYAQPILTPGENISIIGNVISAILPEVTGNESAFNGWDKNADDDFSGDYLDLTNKPIIPTVNNTTISLQRNGVNIGDFTTNQATPETFNFIDENTQLSQAQVNAYEEDPIALDSINRNLRPDINLNTVHRLADNDLSSTNELQTLSKIGLTVTLSNGGGSFIDEVDDADNDPYNELDNTDDQQLVIDSVGRVFTISLEDGGNVTFEDTNTQLSDPEIAAFGYIKNYTVTESDVTQHQAALQITESQITDLVHFTNADETDQVFAADSADIVHFNELSYFTGEDITGNESAFNGWDKNADDDFSGDYRDLSNKPTIPSGNQIIDWTLPSQGTIDPSNYVDNNTQLSDAEIAALGYVKYDINTYDFIKFNVGSSNAKIGIEGTRNDWFTIAANKVRYSETPSGADYFIIGQEEVVNLGSSPAFIAQSSNTTGAPRTTYKNTIQEWAVALRGAVNSNFQVVNSTLGTTPFQINRTTDNIMLGTDTDNGTDILQAAGTVSFFPATSSNQGIIKSQLDAEVATINSTFSNYLPLTGGALVGSTNLNSLSNTRWFYISRTGSFANEYIKIGVDDMYAVFNRVNDEKAAYVNFNLTATDTENSDGSDANSAFVQFYTDYLQGSGIKVNGNTVYHAGNSNKPDVNWSVADPTVNAHAVNLGYLNLQLSNYALSSNISNYTITLQRNGVSIGNFTLNQAFNETFNIDVNDADADVTNEIQGIDVFQMNGNALQLKLAQTATREVNLSQFDYSSQISGLENNKVPYTGATGSVNLGGYNLSAYFVTANNQFILARSGQMYNATAYEDNWYRHRISGAGTAVTGWRWDWFDAYSAMRLTNAGDLTVYNNGTFGGDMTIAGQAQVQSLILDDIVDGKVPYSSSGRLLSAPIHTDGAQYVALGQMTQIPNTLNETTTVTSYSSGMHWALGLKNTYNSTSTEISGVGMKLRLGSKGEDTKWSGISTTSTSAYGNAATLDFWANEVAGMRLSPNQNLLIGTISDPGYRLYVNGTTGMTGNLSMINNAYIDLGPNTAYGKKIRIGGNGRTATDKASVVTTNGNLHIDAADGYVTLINYYDGNGVYFGSGNNSTVAIMDTDGQLYKGGSKSTEYFHEDNANRSSVDWTTKNLRVWGDAIFDTDTGTKPVYISRLGSTSEAARMYTSDSYFVIHSVQDENEASVYGSVAIDLGNQSNQLPVFQVRDATSGSSITRFTVDGKTGNVTATGNINADNILNSVAISGTSTKTLTLKGQDGVTITSANFTDLQGATGTGVSGRLAYWNSSTNITSDADLTFDGLNLRVGATNGTGTVNSGNFVLTSDRRLKKKIEKISNLSIYDDIDFVQFRIKADDTYQRYGVVAQEVEKVNNQLVRKDKNGYYSVAYIDLLIAKTARQDEQIKSLEDKIERLIKLVEGE